MTEAGAKAGIRWDREKNWKGNRGTHLGVVVGDRIRHQKYRTQKASAAWNMVRRLSKLSAAGKRKVIVQMILPILTYGCELHYEPIERQRRLAAECQRWIVGAYAGSNAAKVEELTGISELERMMMCKRIRWAASVYGRQLPELRQVAEPILRQWIEEDAVLRWMGSSGRGEREVQVVELDEGRVQ